MKTIIEDLKQIYVNERFMLIWMILNLVGSIALFIFSIVNLNPDIAVVKIGYGDIGGYRSGSWTDLLTFPVLAIVFGIIHNFITLRIFRRRGAGMAKFFLIITSALILGSFVVFIRLMGTS